jgi:hypothetical protein
MAKQEQTRKQPKARNVEEEMVTSYDTLVRSVQRDVLIAKFIDNCADLKVPAKRYDAEIRKYVLMSVDLETARPKYYGIDAKFENPLADIKKISAVVMDIQAYRDRLVTILGELYGKNSHLTEWKRKGWKYIKAKYMKLIRSQGSLKNQDEFIETVLWDIIEKRARIEGLIQRVELVLKNLDNAWFTYRKVNENCETLVSRMEGRGGRI